MPLKEELKRKATEESQIIKQSVANGSKRHVDKLPTAPISCSFPDFRTLELVPRKLDFTKREVTKKPNC